MIEVELVIRLLIAVVIGGIIGLQREIAHRPAGMRTNSLVCLGSCLFAIISLNYFGSNYAGIVTGVVTGIGFLGAGIIINSGKEVQGITTGATLWTVAAIGLGIGIGAYIVSIAAGIITLLVLELKVFEKPLTSRIERSQKAIKKAKRNPFVKE